MASEVVKESISTFEKFIDRYRNGNMSALVGAGLSMNVSKHFLSWKKLMRDAVEFLYKDRIELHCDNYCHINHSTTREEAKDTYINTILETEDLLQIASDYIKKKGYREAIDYYIECKIPFLKPVGDGTIEVRNAEGVLETISENALSIHKALLHCNCFLNFYTSNYDNALEIAAEKLSKEDPSISYNVVISGKDLSGNLSKNIVKIHGSLPEETEESAKDFMFDGDRHLRYIIAKEDYATYLQKHEAFSYLMRIAMLQGEFCLIGFSRTDPNYLEWVKWMSDILNAESDDKIFLLDIDGVELAPDMKSFYKNHHIAAINLWSKDILDRILENHFNKILNNEDNKQDETAIRSLDSLVLKKAEYESLKKKNAEDIHYDELQTVINNYKRIILEELFKYLKQIEEKKNSNQGLNYRADFINQNKKDTKDNADSNLFIEGKTTDNESHNCIDEIIQDTEVELSTNDYTPSSLASSKAISYDYRSAWEEIIQSLYKKNPIFKNLRVILAIKQSVRFPKVIFPQESVINHLMTKEPLSEEKATLFAMAVSDIGQIPSYYSNYHKDDVELNKLALWVQLKKREETLRGNAGFIEVADDASRYEQIQRYLFHLDFHNARDLVENWDAKDFWIQPKAMRLAVYPQQLSLAKDLLDKAITQETNPSEKLFEVILANYIYRQWPRPYSTEEFWRYGIDGQGDLLNSMMSSLRGKEEKPKRRNWIGTIHYLGDGHGDYCKSLRILQFIMDSGIYLSLPGTYMFEIASWYRVFTNLYEHFPYPCFFYSIQYNDKDVLRRIGEDFAYNEGLQDFVQDILLKSLSAITNPDTPPSFKIGILNITAAMYVAVNEDLWFVSFLESAFKEFCKDIKSENNIFLYNVKFAIGSLKNSENIKVILFKLIELLHENESVVSDIIVNNLMIDRLPAISVNDIDLHFDNYLSSEALDILDTLYAAKRLPSEVRQELIQIVRNATIDDIPKNRVSLYQLTNLTCDDPESIEIVKQRYLSMDIWQCGVLSDSEFGWTEPKYIRLNLLNDKVSWDDNQFELIKKNLIKNVSAYDKIHERLHEDSFMKSTHVKYLSDMLKYIDGLDGPRKESLATVRDEVERLLADRTHYEDNIDFMMSDQSADVDYAFSNIYESVQTRGVDFCKHDIDFLIDRAIMKRPIALTRNLRCIKLIMTIKSEEMLRAGYDKKLNKLLSVYMDSSSWQSLDLRFAFNYLHSVAKKLDEETLLHKDNAQFWLKKSFVKKFVVD